MSNRSSINVSNKPILKLTSLLVMLFSLLMASQVRSETQQVDKTFSVKSGGTLVIESSQGSIHIETWDKEQMDIVVKKKARNKKRLQEFKLNFVQTGNDILVEGSNDGSWGNKVSVNFLVKVPSKYNLDLQTGGGSIKIADITGNVKVNTGGGSIKIANVAKGNVKAETSGGSIKVGNVNGDLNVSTSGGSINLGEITGLTLIETSGGSIKLASGGKNVKAETAGGSIKIGPVKGNVDVETAGGSIKVDKTEGNVKASTSGGSIRVEGSKGVVDVETAGGSIYVGSSGGSVKAETAGGSINIKQARGFIEAETAGGKIEAEMILVDKKADTHVNLESSGGSVTVYLPRKLAATISAVLKITHNARQDYRIYSDFPLTIKGEDSDRVTAKGDINGGGDKVSLTTINGDIYIKMLKE